MFVSIAQRMAARSAKRWYDRWRVQIPVWVLYTGSRPRTGAMWMPSRSLFGDTEETEMTRPAQALGSTTYDLADARNANEFYQQRGWTDGLPIVPPTEELVLPCLGAAGLAPGDII